MDIDFRRIIKDNYGLHVAHVMDAPRGFVAQTYYIDTPQKRYFFKVRTQATDSFERSRKDLYQLNMAAIPNISVVLPASRGQMTCEVGADARGALFELAEGTLSSEYDPETLGRILHDLHTFKGKIKCTEVFDHSYHSRYAKLLETLFASDYLPDNRLADTMDQFDSLYQRFDEQGSRLQTEQYKAVPTHGDAHNNVMVSDSKHTLVDWDSIMLAPKERDLWLFAGNHDLLTAYGTSHTDLNGDFVDYYALGRLFSDLNGFVEAIIGSNDKRVKDKNYRMLVDTVFGWLLPLVQSEKQR